MKIISFTFFFTFLNKAIFKDSSSRSLPKPKTNKKNGKKNGNGYSFQRKKRCFVMSVGNTKKN